MRDTVLCSPPPADDRRVSRTDGVRLERTNLSVKGLSLNRSQCGSCSTKYDTPTETQVVYEGFGASTLMGLMSIEQIPAGRVAVPAESFVLWLGHRRKSENEQRISVPPDVEARTVSSHFWAGF